MMRVLLINGPNLNKLGTRKPEVYGTTTLEQVILKVRNHASARGATLVDFQSNHEGAIIDWLQEMAGGADGIVINPGGLAHYSVALRDALEDTNLPVVEIHISDPATREDFRHRFVTATAAAATVTGKGWRGYLEAVDRLAEIVERSRKQ
ncbi:MAG: type II 3-dehydroquinate dehydratase [Dehalococcoidia bacterium]|nr:type II 3-dehydroquinate dehydratase [Dehalococcoidia bacterium]